MPRCRHCGKFCAARGLENHEEGCESNKKDIEMQGREQRFYEAARRGSPNSCDWISLPLCSTIIITDEIRGPPSVTQSSYTGPQSHPQPYAGQPSSPLSPSSYPDEPFAPASPITTHDQIHGENISSGKQHLSILYNFDHFGMYWDV